MLLDVLDGRLCLLVFAFFGVGVLSSRDRLRYNAIMELGVLRPVIDLQVPFGLGRISQTAVLDFAVDGAGVDVEAITGRLVSEDVGSGSSVLGVFPVTLFLVLFDELSERYHFFHLSFVFGSAR